MRLTSNFWIAATIVSVTVAATSDASAAKPIFGINLFSRIDADPNKSYLLTEDCGPWLIMAATFSGDDANEQAQELVMELRSSYKLKAYTHQMTFDYSKPVEGKGANRYGEPNRMKYRHADEINEIAVLVGDFPTVDDEDAQKTLQRLKYALPQCMDLTQRSKDGKSDARSLGGLRYMQQKLYEKINNEKQLKGPLGHAFVTNNPMLPDSYYAPKGLDKFIVELNSNSAIEHSLLDCPGKYSVQVASFNGSVVIDQKIIQEIEAGKKMPSQLEKAALAANKMCEALRSKGYEAYEFHDRTSSIVTIGSFDSVGLPRRDGKIEINPQVHRLIEQFRSTKETKPGQMTPTLQPKSIVGIPFDVQPMPVEVPKRSISADYDRSLLGFNK